MGGRWRVGGRRGRWAACGRSAACGRAHRALAVALAVELESPRLSGSKLRAERTGPKSFGLLSATPRMRLLSLRGCVSCSISNPS